MALIIDIETIGEDFAKIDKETRNILIERAKRHAATPEEAEKYAESQLGLLALTGQICAFGMLDTDTDRGAVYYQSLEEKPQDDQEIDGLAYRVSTEKEILEKFWQLSERYSEFVTYSGRTFDIPYIMVRSAIHKIRPKKDLMRGRYLYQQSPQAIHIDLYDQLTFYGSVMNGGGLHLACRAFGIATPKGNGIDGSKVGEYFKQGKYLEIAQYNGRDLFATRDLYKIWKQYLAF